MILFDQLRETDRQKDDVGFAMGSMCCDWQHGLKTSTWSILQDKGRWIRVDMNLIKLSI